MANYSSAREQRPENRISLVENIPLQAPLSMQIELASACNFKCNFCMHHDDSLIRSGKFKSGIMSMGTFEQILNGLKTLPTKIKYITLQSRGESLLNRDIVKMLKLLKEADVTEKVGLYTNGTLLTKEMADGLINGGLDVLHISIEGINSQQYKEITKTEVNFDELVRNIEYFYEHKKNTYLYVKIIDYNLQDTDKKIFINIFQEISDDIYIEKPVDAWQGAGIEKKYLQDNRYGALISKVKICPRIFYAMVVHYDGTVVACDHDWSEEQPLGNVFDTSIADIWSNREFEELRDIHMQGMADTIERCKECIQRKACLPKDNIDLLLKNV